MTDYVALALECGATQPFSMKTVVMMDEADLCVFAFRIANTAPEDDVRAALVELVNLEDMRLRLRSLHELGHGTDYDNYHKALPIAWEAARRALSAQDGK